MCRRCAPAALAPSAPSSKSRGRLCVREAPASATTSEEDTRGPVAAEAAFDGGGDAAEVVGKSLARAPAVTSWSGRGAGRIHPSAGSRA